MTMSLVVIGDALLDVDVLGETTRLCPDAPVPVVDEKHRQARAGGAALAASLAAREGADVTLIAPLATDDAGAQVTRLLCQAGVRVCALPFTGTTTVKTRIRSRRQSLLRVDSGGSPGTVGELSTEARDALEAGDAVLVSDYGCGSTATPVLREVLSALPARLPVVWDPHPRGAAPIPGAHLVTPNEAEAAGWAQRLGSSQQQPGLAATTVAAETLVAKWQARAVAVTLGGAGALLSYGQGAPLVFPAPDVDVIDSCGAGDRFAVAAALALGAGQTPADAVHHAVLAASLFVAGGGAGGVTSTPAAPADRPLHSSTPSASEVATRVHAAGGVVVATGGCFDLLHAGHVATLRAARRLGDCLIVCLNSDASVRRLKGNARPLVPGHDRRRVLEALECVDAVEMFDEDTPEQVLATFRPDVWAKGGDYSAADLPESAVLAGWGGQSVALPYVEGRSTTRLLRAAGSKPGDS
ncbi:MAG: PfkB family carbohydrate kinase [Nocardioidaceae bacterium]